nr:MAG: hypothetical protein [Apis mellifra filamentous-like virus]
MPRYTPRHVYIRYAGTVDENMSRHEKKYTLVWSGGNESLLAEDERVTGHRFDYVKVVLADVA